MILLLTFVGKRPEQVDRDHLEGSLQHLLVDHIVRGVILIE